MEDVAREEGLEQGPVLESHEASSDRSDISELPTRAGWPDIEALLPPTFFLPSETSGHSSAVSGAKSSLGKGKNIKIARNIADIFKTFEFISVSFLVD